MRKKEGVGHRWLPIVTSLTRCVLSLIKICEDFYQPVIMDWFLNTADNNNAYSHK